MADQPELLHLATTTAAAEPAIITFVPGSFLDSLNQTAANRTTTTTAISPSTVTGTATATPTSLGKFFGLDMPTWAPVAIAATVIGLCMIIVCVTCRRCLRVVCCFGCPCKCRRGNKRKRKVKSGKKRKGSGSDSSDSDEEEKSQVDKESKKKKGWRNKDKHPASSSSTGVNGQTRIVHDGSGGAADVEAYLLAHGQLYKVETPLGATSSQQPTMNLASNGGSSSALNASNTLRTGALLNTAGKPSKHAPKVQSPLSMAPVLRASSTTSMGSSTHGSLHSHASLGATMVVQGGQIIESVGFSGQHYPQRIGSGRSLVASASAKSLNKSGRGSRGGSS